MSAVARATGSRTSILAALALGLAACAAPAPARVAAPGVARPPAGPHPVGFRCDWLLDEGRRYRTRFDDGATYGARPSARPVLRLVWYPARDTAVARMPHGRYLELPAAEPALAPLAQALAAHARGVFVEQVLGVAEAELDAAGRAELARLLARPSAARPDAAPAAGPFALVVYHAGAGSSFEDNAALCERLASQGRIVLSSAFLAADGTSLGVDGGRASAEDVQLLLRSARGLAGADPTRVALLGHSLGAQALLRHAARPESVGDALVLLDTTQDYYLSSLPLHDELEREVQAGQAWLTRPMLVAAGPSAIFALCDTLVAAERHYLTVPELGHDEYIAQGLQRLESLERTAPESDEARRAPAVRARQRELWTTITAFLAATLDGDEGELERACARAAARPWSAAETRLVHVPRGVDGPAPWDPAQAELPTPRQFVRLHREQGLAALLAVLERAGAVEPRPVLLESTMLAGSLLHELAATGRLAEARVLNARLRALAVDGLGLLEFLADIACRTGQPERARRYLEDGLAIEPEHAALARKLAELGPELGASAGE